MVKCEACGLPYKLSKKLGITFHRFPKARREAWKRIVDRKNWEPTPKNSYICSQHFSPDCFYQDVSDTLRLRCWAIPTIKVDWEEIKRKYPQVENTDKQILKNPLPYIKDANGFTPSHKVCSEGEIQKIHPDVENTDKQILKNPVPPGKDANGFTPLHKNELNNPVDQLEVKEESLHDTDEFEIEYNDIKTEQDGVEELYINNNSNSDATLPKSQEVPKLNSFEASFASFVLSNGSRGNQDVSLAERSTKLGNYVTSVLQKLSPANALHAQAKISKVLMEFRLKEPLLSKVNNGTHSC